MRVALTGAAGFIGQHVRGALEARGDTVYGSDIGAWSGAAPVDLRDEVAVRDWLCAAQPDAVIHAGAISGAMVARDDPDLVFAVNATGTANVLAAMAACGASRLVFLSSIAVYAARPDRIPVAETFALGSDTAYGQSKIAAERLVLDAAAAGWPGSATVLRISSVYGPHRRTPYLIGELSRHAASGMPLTVTDQRSNMRQFVHVDDVTKAVLLALDRALPGHAVINVSGGTYLSELAIANMAARYLPGLRLTVAAHGQASDGNFGPLDITRARELLGYWPQVTMEHGLAHLFEV